MAWWGVDRLQAAMCAGVQTGYRVLREARCSTGQRCRLLSHQETILVETIAPLLNPELSKKVNPQENYLLAARSP